MLFDKILNKLNSSPPEESFVEPIFFRKTESRVYFETVSFKNPITFMKWFRWLFLIVPIAFVCFMLQGAFGKGSLNSIFSFIFAGCSIFIGLFGFFVISPLLSKVFEKFASRFDPQNHFFPSFDLNNSRLQTPNSGTLSFGDINKLKIEFKKRKWYQLSAETTCGTSHFLLNFKDDLLKQIVNLESLTSIKIENTAG